LQSGNKLGLGLVRSGVAVCQRKSSFELLKDLQAGDQAAREEFWKRYTERLVKLARALISGRHTVRRVLNRFLGRLPRIYRDNWENAEDRDNSGDGQADESNRE
jgi:hypothetical protein